MGLQMTLKPHVNIMLTLTDRPAVTLGDVNGDGRADNLDAALIYAYYNGKITAFPAASK